MKHRQDNTFIIEKNNMPYQVIPDMPEYQELLNQYNSNPELFEEEVVYRLSIEDIKAAKKAEAKYLVEESIYSVYPQHKQNNIGIFGTDEEKLAFKISYTEYLENKEEVYRLTREGFHIAICLDDHFVWNEEAYVLLRVFTYIITDDEKLYDTLKDYFQVLYIPK